MIVYVTMICRPSGATAPVGRISLPPGGSWLPEGQTEEECGQKCFDFVPVSGFIVDNISASLYWFNILGYLPNSSSDPASPGHLPPGGRDAAAPRLVS